MIRPAKPSDDGNPKPYDPLDKDSDCFKPPAEAVEVGCLHCQAIFMSSEMTWRVEPGQDGEPYGFWCCPDPACDGRGFGFDLLPTDPNYDDGSFAWVYDDDEEDDDLDDAPDGAPDGFDPPTDWTGDEDDIPF